MDARDKAEGYCSAFSTSPDTSWICKPIEISDVSTDNHFGNAPRAMMYAQRAVGGGHGGEGESLNFEPEDVSLSAGVGCKFECYELSPGK